MDGDDDFNSSDIETEQPSERFKDAGSKSVDSMLEDAFKTRIGTKIASKQMGFVQGSLKTQYINALW